MSAELLLDAMGWLDDSLIEEAAALRNTAPKRKSIGLKYAVTAAALVAAASVGWWAFSLHSPAPRLLTTNIPATEQTTKPPAVEATDNGYTDEPAPYENGAYADGSSMGNAGGGEAASGCMIGEHDPAYEVTWTSEDGHISFTTDNSYGMQIIDWVEIDGVYTDNGKEYALTVDPYSNYNPDGTEEDGDIYILFCSEHYEMEQNVLSGTYIINDDNSFTVTVTDTSIRVDLDSQNDTLYFADVSEMENAPEYQSIVAQYGDYVHAPYRVGDTVTFRNNRPDLVFRNQYKEAKRSAQLDNLYSSIKNKATVSIKQENGELFGTLINDYRLTDSKTTAKAGTKVTLILAEGCEVYDFSEEQNEWIDIQTPTKGTLRNDHIAFVNIKSLTSENGEYILTTDKIIL